LDAATLACDEQWELLLGLLCSKYQQKNIDIMTIWKGYIEAQLDREIQLAAHDWYHPSSD
jgi:hypothetical protein